MADSRMIGGVILGIIGLFYAILPHSMHTGSGLGFGLSHTVHVVLGVILIVVAALLLWHKKH